MKLLMELTPREEPQPQIVQKAQPTALCARLEPWTAAAAATNATPQQLASDTAPQENTLQHTFSTRYLLVETGSMLQFVAPSEILSASAELPDGFEGCH